MLTAWSSVISAEVWNVALVLSLECALLCKPCAMVVIPVTAEAPTDRIELKRVISIAEAFMELNR